jgi:xanthine dehydrogenase accessory factor
MKALYQKILDRLKEGEKVGFAEVIRQGGSSPRGVGAKMAIFKDGMVGSIGGGRVEAEVIEAAKEVMEKGESKRFFFRLTGSEVKDMDMLCGGEMEVLVKRFEGKDIPMFEKILSILEANKKGIFIQGLPPFLEGHLFIAEDGEVIGEIKGIGLDQLQEKLLQFPLGSRLLNLEDGKEVFVEVIEREPVLFVFGGGHIAQELVPLAKRVGFRVVVIDDREAFANKDRFPLADELIVEDFEKVSQRVRVDEDAFLVIVTRGHLHDYTVIKQYLRSPARYIGMIGSRRKRDLIFKQLLSEGFSEEELKRVHSPIGLPIGAETPEEIAVSIIAELIKVRRGVS